MTLRMVAVVMISACGFGSSGGTKDSGVVPPTTDSPLPPLPDAQQCFGSFINVCLSALPTAAITVSAADLDINTGTEPTCDSNTSDYCVIAATSFSVAAGRTLRGHGTKPLILIATTAAGFDLAGTIDVSSSHDGTLVGAGAFAGNICALLSQPAPVAATVVGGGFGGSFGGKGGAGAAGGGLTGTPGTSGAAVAFPVALRGGCPGGSGAGGTGVLGGSGGGSVFLIARALHLDGAINASGAGGHGGAASKSGAGGGGSGGLIVLESPSILGSGSLFANGGGGGEGGAAAGAGADGVESTGPATAGAAGNGANGGGAGGDGSSGASLVGGSAPVVASANGGGGAGGGGAGFIRAAGATTAMISPPAQ